VDGKNLFCENGFVDSLVEVKNLAKTYGKTQALRGISFVLKEGEILGLLGPNGAGKTTALHIILGLLAPTSGKVSVFGLAPAEFRHSISKRLNFSSAYVQLPSNLKVTESLTLFARIYNVPNASAKIGHLLETFDLAPLRNRVAGSLSSGEKTRLNLAKSLLNDPELLIFDEPTASLDPDMADTIRRRLQEIQRERKIGILYTSHNMFEVEQMCHRILFIHLGKIIAEGRPAEIRDHFATKTLEETFIKIVRSGDLVTEGPP
jgi:ABC-2 type transport system ATP-binding protein